MPTMLKSAAALGAVAFATAAIAQNAPPPSPPANAQPAPPRQGPPRRAPQPYKPSPAVYASFAGRNANFTGVIDPNAGQMCYLLNAAGINGATSAKIVSGTPDKPGAVAVNLQPPTDGTSGTCYTLGADTAKALLDHPERYYLEVDNDTYPTGAAVAMLHAETYG
ncbi:MAG TPA: CHRD domain-containing protein [Croceibacterium sp.]|jgi:hypothetical protein